MKVKLTKNYRFKQLRLNGDLIVRKGEVMDVENLGDVKYHLMINNLEIVTEKPKPKALKKKEVLIEEKTLEEEKPLKKKTPKKKKSTKKKTSKKKSLIKKLFE